jgi:dipeptidyl-peptidase 4
MSTTQDYQAAEQLLRRPARPGELVIGDKVRPQWIDGGARFWYGVSNGAGRRFVLVGDFLVRELMGTQPPAYRPSPIAIDPELLGELFA